MSIRFVCDHCGKEIKAPDGSGGRRGKCPYCHQSCYIPAPVSDDELLDLAPEQDVPVADQEREALQEQERKLISEMTGATSVPLEERDDLTPEDLHHLVANYCMDTFNGKLEAAEAQVDQLSRFSNMAQDAIGDFLQGKAEIPSAIRSIPAPVLEGFLKTLKEDVAEAVKKQKK